MVGLESEVKVGVAMRAEVLGVERCRRCSDVEKRQIVEESLEPAVTVGGILERNPLMLHRILPRRSSWHIRAV